MQYVLARRRGRLCRRGESCEDWIDRNIVHDWQRHFARNDQARGPASTATGDNPVADCSDGIVVADSCGMDCAVMKKARKKSKNADDKTRGKQSSSDQSSKMRMRIEAAIRRIPKGKVSTYGAVARAAKLPGAARFVARVLHRGFGLP